MTEPAVGHVGAGSVVPITLRVDGEEQRVAVEARTNLADALREQLGVTGVRVGCDQGVCGSCTVLVGGVSQRSCLTLAMQAEGAEVTTIAGLADSIDDLRAAFSRHFAVQCGFCASGALVTAAEWLSSDPPPAVDEMAVRQMLSGTICRCTGYEGMVRAILEVASERLDI